jgi:hypothetical protein
MPDFWENALRFPRFFISSMLGLILIIVGPFFNLLRNPKTSIVFLLSTALITVFISLTLQAMLDIKSD